MRPSAIRRHQGQMPLFLEPGVGGNTPVIIYPFWKMILQNRKAIPAFF